jgi:hypothetical protein
MLRAAGLLAIVAWGRLGTVAIADDGTTWVPYGSRPVVHCRPLYHTDVTLAGKSRNSKRASRKSPKGLSFTNKSSL